MKKPSQKISDLKLKIPNPPDPVGSYSAYIFSNNLLFMSGQLSIDADGKMTTGKIGKELNLEQGQEAAYLCALNIIAQVKKACKGDIDKVNKCSKKIKKYKPKIQLGFNRRYDPGHSSIKQELRKGKIGKLEKIIITSRDPAPPSLNYLKVSGGIFKDMMIHDFDLLRFYLEKDEIENIFTTASNISDKRFDKIKDYELASCLLKSKQGVQCIITNSRHCSFGYDQRVELFGSKGMLISGNKSENETEIFTKNNTSQKKPLLNFFIDRYVDAYRLQLDELALYSRKKKSPISSFEDGRRALIIANAASQSLKQRKQIKIKF